MTFEQYIEQLAEQHKEVRHNLDDQCHFSCLQDDATSKLARNVRYPFIFIDGGDFDFAGQPGNILRRDSYTLMFLDHVRDSGNTAEVQQAFRKTKKIMLDFLKRISRDKRTIKYKFLNRFEIIGTEGTRVSSQENNLYGWVIQLINTVSFNDVDCDNAFDE